MKHRARILSAVLVLGSWSCATSGNDDTKRLQKSVEGYNEAFRWKNYELAATYLPADARPAFVASYEEDDKSLHVEGYQVINVIRVSPSVAHVLVRYRFMQLPSVTLETKTVTQHWAQIGKEWVLETEDNPIRVIENLAQAKPEPTKAAEQDSFGGPEEPKVEVEVYDPDGNLVDRRNE